MTRPDPGIAARCEVKRVIDGDTVDVELRIPARIRLLDCNAPESRTKDRNEKRLGIASKAHLSELATGKRGLVFIPTLEARSVTDILTLDRLLGRVWIDGDERDLSERQVASGHARKVKP